MTVNFFPVTNKVAPPTTKSKAQTKLKRKGGGKVSPSLKRAAKEYKEAYRAVYHMNPGLTFDGKWVRIHGQELGVSLKRLKELTVQLRNRIA